MITKRQKNILILSANPHETEETISITLGISLRTVGVEKAAIRAELDARTHNELLLKLSDPTGERLMKAISEIPAANDPEYTPPSKDVAA